MKRRKGGRRPRKLDKPPTWDPAAEIVRKFFIEPVLSGREGTWGEPLEDEAPPGTIRVSIPDYLEPAANRPSTSEWLFAEVARRKQAGDIPSRPTQFAEQLARQMAKDVRAGKCSRAISARSIRVRLYDNKLWPLK